MKKVSIIVPCRNEEKYISLCLESIIKLDFPKEDMEIFVCDGMSEDKTVEIVNSYIDKYPFIKLIRNEKKIAPTALNLALKEINTEFITRIDAHAEVYPDFLQKSMAEFDKNKELGCVGGMLNNVYADELSRIISYAMSSSFGVGSAYFRTGQKEGFVDTVAFGTYKKEVFDKVGIFDEELVRNQDDEFNFRVTKAGYKILLKRNILAKYYVRAAFKKLFKQYFQYGYWKVYVNRKHSTITTFRQLVPLFFVLYLFIGIISSVFSKICFFAFITILILYLSLAFISSFKQTKKLTEIIKVMYSFFILHFSYGFGYLLGIIDFFILKVKPRYNK